MMDRRRTVVQLIKRVQKGDSPAICDTNLFITTVLFFEFPNKIMYIFVSAVPGHVDRTIP